MSTDLTIDSFAARYVIASARQRNAATIAARDEAGRVVRAVLHSARRAGEDLDEAALEDDVLAAVYATMTDAELTAALRFPERRTYARTEIVRRRTEGAPPTMPSRIVTIVATIRTTADDDRLRAVFENAIETPLEEYDTALIPCDWAPDPDTIGDCVDNPDGEDLPARVEILDLNPARV